MKRVRSGYVAGLEASLTDVGHDMILAASSLPKVDVSCAIIWDLVGMRQDLHVRPCVAVLMLEMNRAICSGSHDPEDARISHSRAASAFIQERVL